jgi:hypothetical protein
MKRITTVAIVILAASLAAAGPASAHGLTVAKGKKAIAAKLDSIAADIERDAPGVDVTSTELSLCKAIKKNGHAHRVQCGWIQNYENANYSTCTGEANAYLKGGKVKVKVSKTPICF